MTTPPRTTPRDRARIELTRQIKEVARKQLAQDGAAALSIRAVARELGLGSPSALYRYFPGRDALLTALIVDAYSALGDAAETAEAAVHHRSVLIRWLAICHGVRDWAVAHPHEYTLIFGSPVPGYAAPPDTVAPATRIPRLLSGLLDDLLRNGEYDPSQAPPVPRAVHRALRTVRTGAPASVPDDLIIRGLMAWTYLLGALSFEIFGHRTDVIDDPAPFFDHEMRQIAVALGVAGSA